MSSSSSIVKTMATKTAALRMSGLTKLPSVKSVCLRRVPVLPRAEGVCNKHVIRTQAFSHQNTLRRDCFLPGSRLSDVKPWWSEVCNKELFGQRGVMGFCGKEWGASRGFRSLGPVCMGRRAAKIATRKGAQDAKKSKIYGRIGKQIIAAVKEGGPNPETNEKLSNALSQAKLYDVPKDIIERNISRASDQSQQDFVEITYEAYGAGGVGIIMEVLTDNQNRAAANVRDVVKKGGGKMADPGSVLFNFRRVGIIAVPCTAADEDTVLLAAMDAGAEDVIEPEEDDGEEIDRYKIVTAVEDYAAVRSRLEAQGFPVDSEFSGLQLLPLATVQASYEAAEANDAMVQKLLDLDDVDEVYMNQN